MKKRGFVWTGFAGLGEIFGMKKRLLSLLGAWCAVVALGGCDKPGVTRVEPPPVVRQAPVETHPFEDGYDAGFELGKGRATPSAKIPKPAEVEPLAREQAGEVPERTERWQRGFVDGYLDGFRNVVTGQK